MDLETLERIAEHYRIFKKVFREARKSLTDESFDKLHESRSLIEDLFIVEIFSCFERFLRNKILAGIKLEEFFLWKEEVIEHIEYMKIANILEALKAGGIDPHAVGYLKHIKDYRDWVAHGRNERKPPPVSRVDFDKAYELIRDIMVQVDRK